MQRFFLAAALAAGLAMATSDAKAAGPDDTLVLELKDGTVEIELRPDLAPVHVARVKELVREGYYDGKKWHRVINGFMAQTGSPKGDGIGGTGKPLKAEFSKEKHVRGIVSAARTSDPNSADAQFFIVLDAASHLDGQYTVWGKVVKGMEAVDKIKKGDGNRNGVVADPDSIVRLRVKADIK